MVLTTCLLTRILPALVANLAALTAAVAQNPPPVLKGAAAFGDWHSDAPGVRRLITPADLPAPFATRSIANRASILRRPAQAEIAVPPGFEIAQFTGDVSRARILRVAPNGDIFASELRSNRVRVMRPSSNSTGVERNEIFATGLNGPFGIAFYPPGDDPRWVYVATTDAVLRFEYQNGDLVARAAPEIVVPNLPTGGQHASHDIAFSKNGLTMFVAVGSASNAGEGQETLYVPMLKKWIAEKPLGAVWGNEYERAAVLAFNPQGKNRRIYATGLRNCVGLAIDPAKDELWCSTNERDNLGDDLVPDFITRVQDGAFYGWPWYYIGDNEDPRTKGVRPDLKGKVTIPDILIQPHSASLEMMIYTGTQFPAAYRGSIFAAEHGSWNRSKRTGYKIIRGIMKDGVPTGEYEDFVTGFVIDDASVWGRPVGVAQLKDGSLVFSDDGNSTLWRVTYTGRPSNAK